MIKTLVEFVKQNAQVAPDKKALCFRNEAIPYAELYNKVQSVAELLRSNKVLRGDRVAITAVSKPEYVVAYLAAQYLGAIAVPLDKNARPDTIEGILETTQPVVLLSDTQKSKRDIVQISLKSILVLETEECSQPVTLDDDDVLELLFTTGTTGRPKGAMLTVDGIYSSMLNTYRGIGMKEDDVILLPLPLNHSFGMRVLRSTLYCGATLVLQNGFSFAKEIENNIVKYDCTGLVAVSASIDVMLGQMQDKASEILGRLRYIEISAGSLDKRLRKKIPGLLPSTELHNTWGSTESGGALFLNLTKHPDKIDSIGKPLDGIDIKLIDEGGNTIEGFDRENYGRMALRGAMTMKGYWNMPEQTNSTLKDGWLITGDMVYRDEDGYIYMLGRADDIINVGGEKVAPIEVENIAGEYEHIKECACIGVPDPDGVIGQIPVLFVVAMDAHFSLEELRIYLSERLEKYKVPVEYRLVRELPRNAMKKIDRRMLKRIWDDKDSADLMNPIMQAIFSRRSIRRFLDKKIPDNILNMIISAGYYAPSGHNMQTWRFTVIRGRDTIERLKEASRRSAVENGVHFYGFENPACIVLVSNDVRNDDGIQDASVASENIMLAAYSYGVGSVWLNPLMTLRNKEPVKTLLDEFGIPSDHNVWSMIAMGYPAAEGNMLAKKKDVVVYVD